jgi:hypothetical protein
MWGDGRRVIEVGREMGRCLGDWDWEGWKRGKYLICIAPTIAGAANLPIAICEIIEGLPAATTHISALFQMPSNVFAACWRLGIGERTST